MQGGRLSACCGNLGSLSALPERSRYEGDRAAFAGLGLLDSARTTEVQMFPIATGAAWARQPEPNHPVGLREDSMWQSHRCFHPGRGRGVDAITTNRRPRICPQCNTSTPTKPSNAKPPLASRSHKNKIASECWRHQGLPADCCWYKKNWSEQGAEVYTRNPWSLHRTPQNLSHSSAWPLPSPRCSLPQASPTHRQR